MLLDKDGRRGLHVRRKGGGRRREKERMQSKFDRPKKKLCNLSTCPIPTPLDYPQLCLFGETLRKYKYVVELDSLRALLIASLLFAQRLLLDGRLRSVLL